MRYNIGLYILTVFLLLLVKIILLSRKNRCMTMVYLSLLLNVLAWIAVGYLFGSYFARYSRCGSLCVVTASVFGSLIGGLLAFIAYGMPVTLLWANNLLFGMIGALGSIYISLPEKERAMKVEQMIRSMKKLGDLYIDVAGIKR